MGENHVTLGQKWRNPPRGQQNNKRITITHPTVAPPSPVASQGPPHLAVLARCTPLSLLPALDALTQRHSPAKISSFTIARHFARHSRVLISRHGAHFITRRRSYGREAVRAADTRAPMPGDAGVPISHGHTTRRHVATVRRSGALLLLPTCLLDVFVKNRDHSLASRNDTTYDRRNRRN